MGTHISIWSSITISIIEEKGSTALLWERTFYTWLSWSRIIYKVSLLVFQQEYLCMLYYDCVLTKKSSNSCWCSYYMIGLAPGQWPGLFELLFCQRDHVGMRRGQGKQDGDVLQVRVLHLEQPDPWQQRVFGGGARGADGQDRPVLLLVAVGVGKGIRYPVVLLAIPEKTNIVIFSLSYFEKVNTYCKSEIPHNIFDPVVPM